VAVLVGIGPPPRSLTPPYQKGHLLPSYLIMKFNPGSIRRQQQYQHQQQSEPYQYQYQYQQYHYQYQYHHQQQQHQQQQSVTRMTI
jgi:hypothetical protein